MLSYPPFTSNYTSFFGLLITLNSAFARRTEFRLLLFLHETTPWTTPRSETVAASGAVDAEIVTHFLSINALKDALKTTKASQGKPTAALAISIRIDNSEGM
jgi:hypothetical protein